jgi:hypothetical protein
MATKLLGPSVRKLRQTMSEQDKASQATTNKQLPSEEKSLLGSAYSYVDTVQPSSQSVNDVVSNDGDD